MLIFFNRSGYNFVSDAKIMGKEKGFSLTLVKKSAKDFRNGSKNAFQGFLTKRLFQSR